MKGLNGCFNAQIFLSKASQTQYLAPSLKHPLSRFEPKLLSANLLLVVAAKSGVNLFDTSLLFHDTV